MKELLFVFFTFGVVTVCGQIVSFSNHDVNIICEFKQTDSLLKADISIINCTKNDIYMYNYYEGNILTYDYGSPHELYVSIDGTGKWFGEFLRKVRKLKGNDTLKYTGSISLNRNMICISHLHFSYAYLSPFKYAPRTRNKILNEIFPFPLEMEINSEFYSFRETKIFSDYADLIDIEIPYSFSFREGCKE